MTSPIRDVREASKDTYSCRLIVTLRNVDSIFCCLRSVKMRRHKSALAFTWKSVRKVDEHYLGLAIHNISRVEI